MFNSFKKYILLISLFSFLFAQTGILNIGFDIDDTVLYSEDAFQSYIKKNGYPIDYGWINQNDKNYSSPIAPTIDLIHFFRSRGHKIFFITARAGINGQDLATHLTSELGYKVEKDVDLFFMPKEKIGDKHERLDNQADISKLIEIGWKPSINIFEYFDELNMANNA